MAYRRAEEFLVHQGIGKHFVDKRFSIRHIRKEFIDLVQRVFGYEPYETAVGDFCMYRLYLELLPLGMQFTDNIFIGGKLVFAFFAASLIGKHRRGVEPAAFIK